MIAQLLVLGLLAGPVTPPPAGTGPIVAGPEQIATVAAGSSASGGSNIPKGAKVWPRAFDPADRAPYVYDWTTVLAADERVDEIISTTMSALGVSLGVLVDDDPDRLPIIDEEAGQQTQIWPRVAPGDQTNQAFFGDGAQIAIAQKIRTNATPYREYERTMVLTVRQQ